MDALEALRSRRTHKVYGPEPIAREVIKELVELACWAPNHNLTEPWRFRVIGPAALEALKAATPEEARSKLDRAPTLVVVSYVKDPDPKVALEDRDATAAAIYGFLLAAHAKGLAAFWRTPGGMFERDWRAAVAVPDAEEVIGVIYVGTLRQEVRDVPRRSVEEVLEFLD